MEMEIGIYSTASSTLYGYAVVAFAYTIWNNKITFQTRDGIWIEELL